MSKTEAAETLAAIAGDNTTDLLALDTRKHMSQSAACEILNPVTKQPTGAKIWLYGKDSERVQAYVKGEANKQLRQDAALAAKGKQPDPPTVEKGEARAVELLTVATDRWEGVNMGGEVVDFTVQRAQQLYAVPFIREQLQDFMGEVENFMKG